MSYNWTSETTNCEFRLMFDMELTLIQLKYESHKTKNIFSRKRLVKSKCILIHEPLDVSRGWTRFLVGYFGAIDMICTI